MFLANNKLWQGSNLFYQRTAGNACTNEPITSLLNNNSSSSNSVSRLNSSSSRLHSSSSGSLATTNTALAGKRDPVHAIIFDMDGVLCSSEDLSRRSAAMVFKQLHGLDVGEEEFIPFGGMGEERFLGGVAEKYSVQDYNAGKAKQLFFDIYINTFAQPEMDIGYPGAVSLVRACKAKGLKTAVGSSAEQVKVDANLAASGFAVTDFDAIIAADKFDAIKPAPDIFLAAAKLMGVEPRNCVVVEDAVAGLQAARNAGMRVVGVTTTLTEQDMRRHDPDLIKPTITNITVDDLLIV